MSVGNTKKLAIAQRQQIRSWRTLWKSFQTSAVGCFSFVETTGLFYGLKLLQRAIGYNPKTVRLRTFDGLSQGRSPQTRPNAARLESAGHHHIATSRYGGGDAAKPWSDQELCPIGRVLWSRLPNRKQSAGCRLGLWCLRRSLRRTERTICGSAVESALHSQSAGGSRN